MWKEGLLDLLSEMKHKLGVHHLVSVSPIVVQVIVLYLWYTISFHDTIAVDAICYSCLIVIVWARTNNKQISKNTAPIILIYSEIPKEKKIWLSLWGQIYTSTEQVYRTCIEPLVKYTI